MVSPARQFRCIRFGFLLGCVSACTSGKPAVPSDADSNAGIEGGADAVGDVPPRDSGSVLFDSILDDSPTSSVECGPGCRLALDRPIQHATSWGHAYNAVGVADTNGLLFYSRVGATETELLRGGESSAFPHLEGSLMSYAFFTWPAGDIVVYDFGTRRHTPYFHFDDQVSYGLYQTIVSDKYVFWTHAGGTGRATLATGEATPAFMSETPCHRACIFGNSIVCGSDSTERMELIDQDTGMHALVDDGGAMQLQSGCSPDRQKVAWIDFRDPPGRTSTYFGARVGGEVYMRELASGQTRRLTHDSPASPVTKGWAAVGDDLAFWIEPCETCEKNFEFQQTFYAAATTLVKLDLVSGRRCRLEMTPYGGYMSVHGHHLYAYHPHLDRNLYLVDVDVDHPAIPWKCEPSGDGG
jgi:hypothetical protein